MQVSSPYIQQLKRIMRDVWMAGDFGVVAKGVAGGAEAFAQRLGISPGACVLDVACGTGNVAIPLARLGARVTGIDIATNLLAQARERAAAENLTIAFDEGDAEQLPYPNETFDAVVTMFGAMFAPQPELVVAEFARVLRPGGLLAMANWTPHSFAAQMFRVTGRHAPMPMGVIPPIYWGHPKIVRDRLASSFDSVDLETIRIDFDFPGSAAEAVTFFRTYFGPTRSAFNRLDESGQAALAADLEALWVRGNISDDPATRTRVPNEYLQVIARLR